MLTPRDSDSTLWSFDTLSNNENDAGKYLVDYNVRFAQPSNTNATKTFSKENLEGIKATLIDDLSIATFSNDGAETFVYYYHNQETAIERWL